jgi:hypothetical protein
MPWEPMWALIALCNEAAVAAVDPGLHGEQQLPPGILLTLPVFQLPSTAAAAAAAESSQTDVAANSSRVDKQRLQTLQLAGICGCGSSIKIAEPTSWLKVVAPSYPELQPASTAALWLSMCNPAAELLTDGRLQPGQQLAGICTAAVAASLSRLQHVTAGGLANVKAAADAAAFRASKQAAAEAVAPTLASTSAAAAAEAAAGALTPLQELEPSCSVEVVAGHRSYLRQVSLQPQQQQQQQQQQGSVCVWYADGCSGPTEGLAYQDVLTPW